MSSVETQLRSRNLRTLALLAGLFLLPLLGAFWMYYDIGWRPAAQVNHGELIEPPRSLPAAQLASLLPDSEDTRALFRGKWSLVYIGDGSCESQCRQALYLMRQTRLALNTNMTRVARVFLVTGGCCDREFLAREHPGLLVRDARGGEAAPLLANFPGDGRQNSVFIVDPLGNLMMRYDARQEPQGLLLDLKKLLSLSHIG